MHRLRLLILLTACFLMASDAWADDLGYVDCASHPESTPVFGKARQTPDSLGAVPCGERFTVLVYGFVFSRIQTKDGKVGYVYSNVITADRGGAAASQAAAARVPATNAPAKAPAAAQSNSAAQMDSPPITTSPVPQKPAAQAGPLFPTPPVPAVTASDMASARAQSAPAATAPAQTAEPPKPASAPVTPAALAPAQVAPAPAASAQPAAPSSSQPSAPASAETQPALQPPAPQSSAPAQPGPLFPTPPPPQPTSAGSDTSSAPASAAEPAPAPAASQPEAAQPAPAPVREASVRSSWERPVPGARQNFLLDLYSGYSFARFTSGGSSTNLNGAMGSFGYNLKPWLQIVGDSSYNFVTISGVKNTLYGNHFGGRFFYHRGARWGFTPFVEALVGGSRLDTSSATVKTSTNCLSYKAGGGIDIRVSRHWEIRAINVDYYRTTFGAGGYSATQNNYWASAGVVLRLFGSGASE